MSNDQTDIAPDSSLVERLRLLHKGLDALHAVAVLRSHLPSRAIMELVNHAGGAIAEMEASAQPDDEINAKYRSRMRGESIRTFTNVLFFIYDPKVEEIRHLDIVQGLAHECRFAGQIPRFLSVAEHSIKVAAISEHLAMQAVRRGEMSADHVPVVALYALLHDAHEAYTKDIPSPHKARICDIYGTTWTRIEQNLQDVIHAAYNLPVLFEEGAQIIKMADKYAVHCEALALKPKSDATNYGPVPPVDVMPISKVKHEEPAIHAVRTLLHGEIVRLCSVVDAQVPADPLAEEPAPLVQCSMPGCFENANVETGTLCDAHASPSKRLADIMHNRPIPGERAPSPPPRPTPEFIPKLSRPPRQSDVNESRWRSAVQSSDVDIPQKLIDEPEFKGD